MEYTIHTCKKHWLSYTRYIVLLIVGIVCIILGIFREDEIVGGVIYSALFLVFLFNYIKYHLSHLIITNKKVTCDRGIYSVILTYDTLFWTQSFIGKKLGYYKIHIWYGQSKTTYNYLVANDQVATFGGCYVLLQL